jgi:hypothetical protein
MLFAHNPNDSRFPYHLSCNGLQALRNRLIDVTLLATTVGVPSTAVAWLTRFCSRGFASVVGFYSGHLAGLTSEVHSADDHAKLHR